MGMTFIAAVFYWFCNTPLSSRSNWSNFASPGRRSFPMAIYSRFNFPEPLCRLDCTQLSEQFYAHLTLLTQHKKCKISAERDIKSFRCIFICTLVKGSRKDARSEAIQHFFWGITYMKDLLPSEEGAFPRAPQTLLSAAYKCDIKSGCKNIFIYPLHHSWCWYLWSFSFKVNKKNPSVLSLTWISIYLHLQHHHIQANTWLKSGKKVPKYATVFLCKKIKERKATIDKVSAGGGPDE